jgi:hypothetical protein
MRTKKCPMCQGEQFFTSTHTAYQDGIMLAVFNGIAIYGSVCLSCGFVSPTVEGAGLAKIREFAKKQEIEEL